jgi:heat shock protein HtpX
MSIARTSLATRTRTWVLIAGLSALLVGVGGLIGGSSGIVLFVGIALVFNLAMYWFSDRLALKASRARPLARGEAPELYREVEELAGRAGIPMPSLHLIPSEQPNAFATGRNPKNAAVAVTEGLLRHLPREQVRGVLAHELAHIANRDVLVTTIAAMIGAAISAVANSMADKTPKFDAAYWKRTLAILVIGRSGARFELKTRQPLMLGPLLARCILQPGSAEQAPSVPYEP